MTKIYYRGAHAAILCYDTTDGNSFAHIRYWCEQLHRNETDTQLYFVGCKCDLVQEDISHKEVAEVSPVAENVRCRSTST